MSADLSKPLRDAEEKAGILREKEASLEAQLAAVRDERRIAEGVVAFLAGYASPQPVAAASFAGKTYKVGPRPRSLPGEHPGASHARQRAEAIRGFLARVGPRSAGVIFDYLKQSGFGEVKRQAVHDDLRRFRNLFEKAGDGVWRAKEP